MTKRSVLWLATALAFTLGPAVPAASAAAKPAPQKSAAKKKERRMSKPMLVVDTTKGRITIELSPGDAPLTCAAVSKLAKAGFYDGLDFHRYEPGFVIQGGDPARKGRSEAPDVKGEFSANGVENKLSHARGAVGLARTNVMDSGNSQFYICIGDATFLDGQYCAFGTVVTGMDVAEQLRAGDVIKKVSLGD